MPTLSLAIIVGAGEAFELERCLKSCQGALFDEIVVTLTSGDKAVSDVAFKYASAIQTFEWIKDFSAARNHCFDLCCGDYIMWLDADDILTTDNYQRLLDLKPKLSEAEVHMVMYNYHHHPDGRPANPHKRERIVKRTPEIRWDYPVHECLTIHGRSISEHPEIAVDHFRMKPFNAKRNLEILEAACAKPNPSARMRFYLAKESLEANDWTREGLARELVDNEIVITDEAVVLCRLLAYKYLLDGKMDQCERYCYKGISAAPCYAEFYCMLADIAMRRNDDAQAIQYFEWALACDPHDGFQGHWESFYDEVPGRNLYLLYSKAGNFKKALEYNRWAIKGAPDNKTTRNDRNFLWGKANPLQSLPRKDTRPRVAWLIPHIDLDNPSIRIRRYNVCQRLVERGIESKIVHGYYQQPIEKTLEEIGDANVVVLTQYGDIDYPIAKALKARGVRLCFDHCELIGPFPGQFETFALADALVCCSTVLGEVSKGSHGMQNAVIIKDAWE